MLKTRDPFQDKRKAGCLIQKGRHAWVSQAEGCWWRACWGPCPPPRRYRVLPVSWVLWPGVGSPNPKRFQTALSAAPIVDKSLSAPTVLHGNSGPQRSLPARKTHEISYRLASVERTWCRSHLPPQKMALSSGCISYWISTKRI